MDPITGIALGSSVLGGVFNGMGAGKQAKEARLSREAEHRRWSAADPLRQQLMQILAAKMGQPSAQASGFDFFNSGGGQPQPPQGAPPQMPPQMPAQAPPGVGGVRPPDPRQQLQAFFASRMGAR